MSKNNGNVGAPLTSGGRRRTRKGSFKSRKSSRKMSKGASSWNQLVMKVYKELKAKNKNVKLGEAMREASRRKKRGQA
jgi:hypothetical protein